MFLPLTKGVAVVCGADSTWICNVLVECSGFVTSVYSVYLVLRWICNVLREISVDDDDDLLRSP